MSFFTFPKNLLKIKNKKTEYIEMEMNGEYL